jgi:serine/threonine-protein kinase
MGKITASQFKLTLPDVGAAEAVDSGWGEATQDATASAPHTPVVDQLVCPECGVVFSSPDATFCPFDGSRLLGAARPQQSDSLIGAVLSGRYQVLARLGEGGMGVVYRVTHTTLGKQFAVKVLRSELARDAELSQRFIREARAMAQISSPHVIQVTDFGELDDGRPFFVMELLSGRPLSSLLREPGVTVSAALTIARHVAEGLATAHNGGIIHRDLKPDNVYVDPESCQVKVLDFGLAYVVGSSRLTRRGVVFGTPQYMSPEQASGGAVDHRADIYALGIMLYEMLAGKVPFEADSYMGVLTKQMYTPPAPLPLVVLDRESALVESERSDIVRRIDELIQRCLAKKPEQRFASMTELMSAIDGLLPRVPHSVGGIPARIAGSPPAPEASSSQGLRRHWVAGSVALCFLIGMGLWGWYGSVREPHGPPRGAPQELPAGSPPAPAASAASPPVTLRAASPLRPAVRPLVQASGGPGSSQAPQAAAPRPVPPHDSPRKSRVKAGPSVPAPSGGPAKSATAPSPASPLSNADLIDPWSQQ